MFTLPRTLDTIEAFFPWNLSLGSMTAVALCAASLAIFWFANWPIWAHILLYFHWRCWYDVGLGLILRSQSLHKSVTRFYTRNTANPHSCFSRLLKRLAKGSLDSDFNPDDYPDEFVSWLVFKHLVNLILLNDSFNYMLLGFKCFNIPAELDYWRYAQYALGVFLIVFNYWAKVDSHRCIGEYCWYWGDFFYRKDLNLTFDGIFELFPHPMYTVGYSLYYGFTLLMNSYDMFYVSLGAHFMQLLFLVAVEEPHIERTYGTNKKMDKNRFRALYDPKSGLFPRRKDNILFARLNIFRSGDFALLGFMAYGLMFCYYVEDRTFCIIQVVVWRLVHWVGLGGILMAQSRFEYWTRHFKTRGRTLYEAFANWKAIYNLSLTMNWVVFFGCCARYIDDPLVWFNDSQRMAMAVGGMLLIWIGYWSTRSTYETVGDFGWFYGDFFIKADAFKQSIAYTGVFRFLNNPDCVTGYCPMYGCALICGYWEIAYLALGSQFLNIIFLNLVEIPHMKKLYSAEGELRGEGPFVHRIGKLVDPVTTKGSALLPRPVKTKIARVYNVGVDKSKSKAINGMYDLYRKVKPMRQFPGGVLGDLMNNTYLEVVEEHNLDEPLEVSWKTVVPHSESDWIGIYRIDVESKPGHSKGRWMFVEEEGHSGSVTFPSALLPTEPGSYEVRYHIDNQYTVVAACPLELYRDEE